MNRRTIGSVGVVVTLFLLSSGTTALAQGRGRGHAKVHEPAAKSEKAKPVEVKPKAAQPVFRPHDRDIIVNYYAGLPPGLAKLGGNLPPGLEKQLRRNGTLPPGLRNHLRPFPLALQHQLGPLPHGYRYGILDRDILLYRTDNYTIADLFRDALR